ncbi:Uu.00g140940.m01.CDS01 [Anthostomella pinea]|uniref:Uu.00g140940.m01.CDS01 n=1 Tax=Anthostomella pinea TaxID=933095 RepID=A0AAI8VQ69_9PEZI|nr:Uu.00g140940.m01.CDS01 [Anthostomella pinea]
MSSPVWFITGASNGFGLILCLRALRAKHQVVGTVRNRSKAADAVKQIESAGGRVVEMDLTVSQASIFEKVQGVGQIDYLVNNAGYSVLGALEQHGEQEAQHQVQTNFFGPVFVMQAALPGMRQRKTGTIVNVTSIAAKDPLPASALYAGTKAALEATSESLAKEVASFGISVLIVEPGAFRTNFLTAMQKSSGPLPDDYKDTAVGQSLAKFDQMSGRQAGDPVRGVERIFEAVTGEGLAGQLKGKVLRLVLGSDALERMKNSNAKFVSDFTLGETVALSTDF